MLHGLDARSNAPKHFYRIESHIDGLGIMKPTVIELTAFQAARLQERGTYPAAGCTVIVDSVQLVGTK